MTGAPSRPLALVLVLAWSGALWWLLVSRDVGDLPLTGSSFVNNLAHAALFGVEALLLGWTLRTPAVPRAPGIWVTASLLALAYAGLLEWRQGFTEGRHSSWLDMLTNAVGSLGAPLALADLPRRWTPLLWVSGLALAAASLATFGPDW